MSKQIRATTGDRGPPEGGVVIHTVEQIGPKMSKLPNGSLLCRDVPLARTGWMMYGPNETPIKVGKETGVAYVERTEKDLFSDATLASFVGASIVDEHPDDDVTPQNWKQLAKGTVLTARRGEGADKDLVIGDVLITDAGLINSIMAGKREVSAGYDADYEQVSDGVGKQTDIIVNHVALVERGRCGPRCAIGDREYQPVKKGQAHMPKVKITSGGTRRVSLDTLRRRVLDAEQALESAEQAEESAQENEGAIGNGSDPGPDGATHIHIHTASASEKKKTQGKASAEDDAENGDEDEDPTSMRFSAIEASIEKLTASVAALVAGKSGGAKEDDGTDDDANGEMDGSGSSTEKIGNASIATGDDADLADEDDSDEGSGNDSSMDIMGKTKDSNKSLETSFRATLAKAEILVPGFRVPTFDSKMGMKKTIDQMCGLRRRCLDAAYSTRDGAQLVNGLTGASTLNLSKMGCKDVALLFNAAANAKAVINNALANGSGKTKDNAAPQSTGPKSLAEINAANKAFWDRQYKPVR